MATSMARWGRAWEPSTRVPLGSTCRGAELGDGVDGAEGVRGVDHAGRGWWRSISGRSPRGRGCHPPARPRAHLSALLLAHHLPRNDVGVVFHPGHQHGVSGTEVGAAPGLRDKVDRIGGPRCEDDFFGGRRRCGPRFAGAFVGFWPVGPDGALRGGCWRGSSRGIRVVPR